MAVALLILPIVAVVIGTILLRDLPRRRQVCLALFAVAWSGIVFVVGYSMGGIAPQYRGNIVLQQLLRATTRALEAGECDQARAAFIDANRFVEAGGSVHEGAALVGARLRGVSDDAAPANPTE